MGPLEQHLPSTTASSIEDPDADDPGGQHCPDWRGASDLGGGTGKVKRGVKSVEQRLQFLQEGGR